MDINLQANQQNQIISKQNFFSRWLWVMVGFLILLILSIGLIFLLVKKNKTNNNFNIQKAEDIRSKFVLPEQKNDSKIIELPEPTPSMQESSKVTVPLVTITPTVIPTLTPTLTPAPEPTIYENVELGFSMEIPYNWQSTIGEDGHTVVFVNQDNENISIQSYLLTNETLEVIREQLLGSSSVTGVKNTTFLNQPALAFKTVQDNKFGIATIYNNKIYYIITASFNTPPVNSFEFR